MTPQKASDASEYKIPQYSTEVASETPIYDELKTYYQSVEQRRGYITFYEHLSRTTDSSRQITELREQYLLQKDVQRTPIFRAVLERTIGRLGFSPYEPRTVADDSRKELLDAESELGATIFGKPPEGQYWTFHQDVVGGMYEWRLLMFQNGAENPFNSLVYTINPTQGGSQEIRKRHITLSSDQSRRLEPTSADDTDELITLAFATEKYSALIPEKLYREHNPRHSQLR